MKYFKNCKTLKELKDTYKKLLKENHPDNGGDLEIMKEINVQFDSVFPIFRDQAAKEAAEPEEVKKETAGSVRRNFYTAFGWEGSRYDSSLTLKEIAKIVRGYVKKKYPTCKFSVRTSYGSMCQSLIVKLLEFPQQMFMTAEELKEIWYTPFSYVDSEGKTITTTVLNDIIQNLYNKFRANYIMSDDDFTQEEFLKCYTETVFEKEQFFYGVPTEYFKSVVDDVNAFIASYNYDDSDSMIDYFSCNFYGGKVSYNDCKFVPKTARIKRKKATPAAKTKKRQTKKEQEAKQIEKVTEVTYKITKGEDTRDMSELWVVRINENLNKQDYIEQNKKMRDLGGYYSKFKHGFIFRYDPSEKLA